MAIDAVPPTAAISGDSNTFLATQNPDVCTLYTNYQVFLAPCKNDFFFRSGSPISGFSRGLLHVALIPGPLR